MLMHRFVASLDRQQYELIGLTRSAQNLTNFNGQVVVGDMRNTNSFEAKLKGCSVLIHAAAITHTFSKKTYEEVNLTATQHLINGAKRQGIEQFIFISSRTAGAKSGHYGRSKWLAEQYLKEQFTNWLIFRPAEIYGGQKAEGIESLIQQALHKRVLLCPIQIPSPLFPIHLDDAVRLMIEAIFQEKRNQETITINGAKGFSYHELIQHISSIAGKKPYILPIPRWVMFFIKRCLETIPLPLGIMPDQIARLYSIKEHQTMKREQLTSLDTYIQNMI